MNKNHKRQTYRKTQEQLHMEDLERLRKFRPMDDTFMRSLFRDNAPLAQFVLRIVMDKPDLTLTSFETQADMKRVTGAKSVCLDAYATDSEGKKYDIEVQRSDEGADVHRARYISSVMDIENLDEGHAFTELPDTYVIFITEKDQYADGEPIYMIRNMNVTSKRTFDDGRYIIYVNGEYRGDSDIGKLMHDFNCADADEMHFKILADKTRYLKKNEKGVTEMCRIMDEMKDEFYAEGREQGLAEGMAEGMEQGLAEGRKQGVVEGKEQGQKQGRRQGRLEQSRAIARKLRLKGDSVEEIADLVGYSVSTVSKWLAPGAGCT